MSDLIKTNNNDLLLLAEELNINLDSSSDFYSGGGSKKSTSYSRPKKIRSVFDTHKSDGVIKWTSLHNDGNPSIRESEYLFLPPKEEGGEPIELGNVIELRGAVMLYQQRDELRYFDGEKTNVLCSVLGYTEKGQLIKALPTVPYGMKYAFEKDMSTNKWSVNNTKPNPSVEKLGLVGYRGEKTTSCSDCIKCGFSTEVIPGIGDGGSDKRISCDPRGKLYLAVFEVLVRKNVKTTDANGKSSYVMSNVSYPVSSLLDLNGNNIGEFVFMEVPLSKTNIQGRSIKSSNGKRDPDLSVVGFESYCRDLHFQFKNSRDPLRNPVFHYLSLTYRKSPGPSPLFQAHFGSLGAVFIPEYSRAFKSWSVEVPSPTIESLTLEPSTSIQVDGTINVPSSPSPSPSPSIRTISQPSDYDLDSMPF